MSLRSSDSRIVLSCAHPRLIGGLAYVITSSIYNLPVLHIRLEEILSEIHEWIQTSRNTAEQLEGNWERTNEYLKVDHFVVSVTPELLR